MGGYMKVLKYLNKGLRRYYNEPIWNSLNNI